MEDRGLAVRPARPEDFDAIVAVLDDWWGRPVSGGLTRLFLDHFCGTSLIAEHDREHLHHRPAEYLASPERWGRCAVPAEPRGGQNRPWRSCGSGQEIIER